MNTKTKSAAERDAEYLDFYWKRILKLEAERKELVAALRVIADAMPEMYSGTDNDWRVQGTLCGKTARALIAKLGEDK